MARTSLDACNFSPGGGSVSGVNELNQSQRNTMNPVKEVTQHHFEAEVLDATSPVLVDAYAPWCGPCRKLAPVLDAVAADYADRVKVVKVNVDEAPDLAARFQISGVPTLLFFRNGRAVDSLVGEPSLRTLRARLDALAGANPAGPATTTTAN